MNNTNKTVCFSIEPLNKLLVPESFGNCCVDYRLPWLTFVLLSSLSYTTDAAAEQILFSSFASQLEDNGLFHYAVAVSMMNNDERLEIRTTQKSV